MQRIGSMGTTYSSFLLLFNSDGLSSSECEEVRTAILVEHRSGWLRGDYVVARLDGTVSHTLFVFKSALIAQ